MLQRDSLSQILNESALDRSDSELSDALEAELAELDDVERVSFGRVMMGLRAAGQGASTGAAMGSVGGPWGTAIGAAAGAAMGGVSSATSRPAPGKHAPRPPSPPKQPAVASNSSAASSARAATRTATQSPQAPAMPVATPATATASRRAAAQLLYVIRSPTTQQALAALVSGSLGKSQVKVGDTTAPPAAFVTLLGSLAAQALDQVDDLTPTDPAAAGGDAYLRGEDGEYAVDPSNPEARARALLQQLQHEARAHLSESPMALTADTAGEWLVNAGVADLISLRAF